MGLCIEKNFFYAGEQLASGADGMSLKLEISKLAQPYELLFGYL